MIMHNSPSRCNRNLCVFLTLRESYFAPREGITFRDRYHYFPCGKIASMLCNKTITCSPSPLMPLIFSAT